MKKCSICGRALDQESEPLSTDCGGDCWGCIGEIEAEMGYEPSRETVRGELEMGIRPIPAQEAGNKRQQLSKQDKALFLAAWSNFEGNEGGKQACDSCGASIVFERQGAAILHHCSCGKFNGALRGL